MDTEKQNSKIELRSEEIEELLSRPPGSMVRWGITIFFGIIVVAVIFCSYVKYPKIISAPVLITTENPATWVVAKSTGKIDSILVQNNDTVRNGQIIAAISNPCLLADALRLKAYLRSIQSFINTFDIDQLQFCNQNFILGELQPDFSNLNNLLKEYQLFHSEQLHQLTYESMRKEKREQEQYLLNLKRQKSLCIQTEQLTSNKLRRDSVLYNQKAILISEYENTKQQSISGRIESPRVDLAISTTTLSIIQLENKMEQTLIDHKNKISEYKNTISAVYEQLLARLSIWENTYVLHAPTDGVVSFSTVWSSNQQVNAGDKVFAILSSTPGRIVGKCSIPVNQSGKLIKNQQVAIKLDSYPYLEFGVVNGVIHSISKLPFSQVANSTEIKFLVAEVVVEQPLVTSYRKDILFTGELTGVAEIVTEDMTLIEHFVSPIRYLFNK